MTNLNKIILFFLCCIIIQTAQAVLPIKIETKTFGNDVVFIFHRDKDQIISISAKNKLITAQLNIPSEYELVNPSEFKKHASNFKIHPDKQKVVFSINDELQYQKIINGEMLDAIKFKSKQKKEEDLTKIGIMNNDPGAIKYIKNGDDHSLSFDFGNDDSKIAAFIKDKYLWIIFDQKKIFSFQENKIFSKFELIASEKGTVIRLIIDPKFKNLDISKTKSGWNVSLNNSNHKKNTKSLLLEELPNQNGYFIKGNFVKDEIITFLDPELGDLIATIPVSTETSKVSDQKDQIEFSLLKTAQGIAIILLSDDSLIEKYVEGIKIIANTKLPEEEFINPENSHAAMLDNIIKLPSILPYLDKSLDIIDFNQQKSRLISDASAHKDDVDGYLKNLALAKFFFINTWYYESLDALKIAKQFSPNDYQSSLQARFLAAVNYTMTNQFELAKDLYKDLLLYNDIKQIPEINLWNLYNEFALGNNPNSIGVLNCLSKTISLYSDDKYWRLVLGEIELGLINNDLKILEKLFKEVREPAKGSVYSNSLKFYKANYYRKKGQINLAKQYFKELIEQESDLYNKVRAEFNLSNIRYDDKEISSEEMIKILERLRFVWRGDQLEYDILFKLANLYRDQKDILNALRIYQYAQLAFANKINNFHITTEMAKIFNSVFLPGGVGETMDDFTVVALFFEFKELNPIGDQGDEVIISIAKRLIKLDLLDSAAELLRHQVTYRLKDMKKVLNADILAVILILDNKPNEAILVLDETDKDNFNYNEHQYRIRLKSKALMSLGKYEEAMNYLKDDNSNDAEILRREILFQEKNWAKYIDQVSGDLDKLLMQIDADSSAAQDILRLSIAYYMMNNHEQLVNLSAMIDDKNIVLKNTIDLLLTSSGGIDYKNLDSSLNIDQMKILLDKYKNQFLDK
ncbi:MAG: hypothetical protein EKK61_04375 [Rickettsiales bacterium]|nr:MAG: hypothetical protein EKK61_04375 [Rickettsiales bacterium]